MLNLACDRHNAESSENHVASALADSRCRCRGRRGGAPFNGNATRVRRRVGTIILGLEEFKVDAAQPRAPANQLLMGRARANGDHCALEHRLTACAPREVQVGGRRVGHAQDEDRVDGIKVQAARHVLEGDQQRSLLLLPSSSTS